MLQNALARVHWRMGQTLLPSHFVTSEMASLADTAARLKLMSVPFFGIGDMRWNESALVEGTLNITELTVILPGGELINIPGNAARPTFSLDSTGQTRVSIYFHLLGETEARADAMNLTGQDTSIERVFYDVVINSEESSKAALQTFGLADFVKDAEGRWSLSHDYVPAIVQVGRSPFLMKAIDELDKQLENFHFKLVQQIQASFLSGDSLHSSRKILQAVYRLQGFIQNLLTDVHFHPFYVFEALKEFYIELCIFQNTSPAHVKLAYVHHDIAGCMYKLLTPIFSMLKQVKGDSPYMPFDKKDGVFRINNLPDKVSGSSQVYFLIQKERVGDRFNIQTLKLASASRLAIVNSLSLKGVQLEKIERPPFQHSFGPEVEFYKVLGGEEWDFILRERTISFYDQPEIYRNIKAFVYWREG